MEKALRLAFERGVTEALPFLEQIEAKEKSISKYIKAYQNYCWPVNTIDDYQLAPFHILATQGKVHVDQTNQWHMETIADICKGDPNLFVATRYQIVNLNDQGSYDEAVNWWMELTHKGGEGMVVKPFDFIARGTDGILQPAIKCRGHEYLRIIYGPEYDLPTNIERLKNRGLARKQSLALREFALGIEGLERFVNAEPLRLIHECVFGVLALESEDVDPRL